MASHGQPVSAGAELGTQPLQDRPEGTRSQGNGGGHKAPGSNAVFTPLSAVQQL